MRDRTPQSPVPRSGDGRRLIPYYAANVLFAAGLFSHAFLYNFYLGRLGHGESVMGLAAASLTAGGLAALLPAGGLVDRAGARRAFVAASVLAFAGLVLGAFAESGLGIGVSAFLAGAGTATWRVSMGPLLMRLAGPAARSRAFSWNVAVLLGAGSVWTVLSGLLPGWLGGGGDAGGPGGLRLVLILGAVATLLGAVPVVWGPGVREAVGGAVRDRAAGVGRLSALRQGLVMPRSVVLFVAVVALWMAAGGLVIPFFNVFFEREHGMSVGGIGVLFGAAQAVTAAAVFGGGWLAGRAGPRRMLLAWALPFAPLLWSLALVTWAPLAVVFFVLQGFVPPATNPLIDQVLLERTPEDRHGAVSTWRNAATELSGLAGAGLGGVLLEATSFNVLLGVAGCVALLGLAGLAWALGRLSGAPVSVVAPALS